MSGLDPAYERAQVELNAVAVHDLTLAVLPQMVERRAGAILNVGSAAGNMPIPNNATYAATKAFVNTFSESLRGELKGTGVNVTLLAPGPVRTETPDPADASIVDKLVPYSTPVPLYLRWPSRWGDEARTIGEPVSNVDLAPTFCALAGCEPGDVDGLDLTPLLDGDVAALDRRFIYEEYLHPKRHRPGWYGLRTTGGFAPDERWVYTEYDTGEVELYDLVVDPWQLENLASSPERAAVRDELAAILHAGVIGPDRVTFRTGSATNHEEG